MIPRTGPVSNDKKAVHLRGIWSRFSICLLVVLWASAAIAAPTEIKIFINTDNNQTTGCLVATASGPIEGVEQIFTTTFDTVGSGLQVTGITRQVCVDPVANSFGSAETVDAGGWAVGDSGGGNLLLETHAPLSAIGSGPFALAFTAASASTGDAIVRQPNGSAILYPSTTPGPRRRAVGGVGLPRVIVLDGVGTDWNGLSPLVAEGAGIGSPALSLDRIYVFEGASDLFFRFDILSNPNAPHANPDLFSLLRGGVLNVAPPGVLANDTDPAGRPLTASLVAGPQHGVLNLNANGGFNYSNDGSNAPVDSFVYKASNGSSDSNAAQVTLTIINGSAPAITSANSTTFTVGIAGSFQITTSGSPTPTLSESGLLPTGVTFTANGNGTGTLAGTPASGTAGVYTITFSANNGAGTATQTFTLTVNGPPTITTAAANQTVCPGATATFTAAASGFPAPSVQWRVSTNGGATFTDIPGATSNTLSFTANAADNGNLYRAVFTNSSGAAQTTATLTVNSGAPVITTNPANQTVCAGANASFTAAASGSPAPTIQWQVSSGGPFTDIPGATSGTLTFATTAADNGKQYRAIFTNSCGTSTTTAATLTVNTAPAVATNPVTQTVCDNTSVSFTAASSGSPAPTVQWQVSSGGPFADIPGATSTTLTFTAMIADNGKQYHAVFTNSCGTATTTAAVLNVTTAPAVTSNPADQTVCAGLSATFTATSSPVATVQWQVSTGGPFTNIPGANSTTLSFITSPGQNGNRYQAVFTNSCGTATTTSALLTVFVAPAVTAEPTNQTACDGASVSFTSTGGGSPAPTVQWQVSTDGGTTFNDVTGATSTTLTFNAAAAQNGNLYHAVFTNSCGTATSANASLTVNTSPAVTTNPLTQTVCKGSSVSFIAAASGSPAPTVQWQISTDAGATFNDIPGETSATYTFTAALTDNGHQYRAVFTNSCSTATTTAATLTVDDTLTITTQPTNQTVCTPNSATFTAAASGPATVQWQVSSGGPFTDIPGATSTTLTFTPVLADNGKQYQAVFINSCGTATTTAATLTVHAPPAVTTPPTNQTVCNGATATFTAAASGTPAPTVQWQVSSGGPFSDIPGATSPTLTFTATSADNSKQYRAVFTNSCNTATTNAATLTVPTVAISPAAGALTAAIYHAGYSQTFTGSGGTAPYTFAIAPATPPAGLSFNTSTGVLSGSAPTLPNNTGNFSFSISATDSNGCQHSQSYTLEVKPGATNDTYSNVVGNTQAWVSGGTTTQPATPAYTLTGSVLANDVAPVGATASAVGTTTNGGSVAVASDGTFLYTPPVGTITNDTFTYTITSNGATNTAVVTIQFNSRVWWVKNNAAAGDGRSNTPFNTLSSAGSSSAANDIIFVYAGDGTTTNQNSGITLKNNQLLTGEALALVVNGQTLVAAGATPLIGNSGGAVITVANGDFIQGLNITAVNTAGISVGAGVTGTTSIGTVSITASASASGVFIAGGSSSLTWTNGGITISAGGSAGAGVNATGGSGNITLTNVAINVNAGGTGATGASAVAIASKSGGGLTLTGGSTVTAGTAGSRQIVSPIQITNSVGTYSFGNRLVLFTTGATATGFSASNSGTVTATDTTSTIDTTGSSALNVTNTTIGASGLTFQSISANGGSNGIVLDTTGSSGGLTVNGDGVNTSVGGNSSGGTIQNMSGADGATTGIGIYLNNTSNVTTRRVHVTGTNQNFGIFGSGVTSFVMDFSTVDGSNGTNVATPFNEGSVTFLGLFGTSSINSSIIKGGRQRNVNITNSSGTSNITITGSTIRDTSTAVGGDDNLFIQADNSAVITAHVQNNTFKNSYGDHTQVNTLNNATMTIVFTGNFFSLPDPAWAPGVLGGGVTISGGNAGSSEHVNFNISNNGSSGSPLTGTVGGGALNVNQGSGGGTWQGQVSGNWIGDPAIPNSGASASGGIRVENHSVSGTMTAIVDGNNVRQWNSGPAINFQVGDTGNVNAAITLTVTNNSVNTPGPTSQHGIVGNFGADIGGTNAVCADINTNNVDLGAIPPNSGFDIRVRQRNGSTVRLPGYAGAFNDTAAVIAFIQGQNTLSATTNKATATVQAPGGGFIGGAACAAPIVPTSVQPGVQNQ